MTQPPDERDPTAGDTAQPPWSEPPSEPPASGEAPTQAWTPELPPSPPDTTFGGQPPPPPTNPIISAAPTPQPGPAVAWAAPAAAPDVGAPGLRWADSPSRIVAYILDSILIAFIAGIVISILGVGMAGTQADPTGAATSNGIFYALTGVIGGVYFILSWSGGRRATPAQRLFNIQVGNAFDGRALTTTQAVKRWIGLGGFLGIFSIVPSSAVLGAVNLLEFVWFIVLLVSTVTSSTKQGIHDRFANSAVVRPTGARNNAAMACLVIVIGLLVVALLSIVALIFLGGQVSEILSDVGNSV
jgi:uncharacterized RDD family membrane protein YckC